MIKMQLDFEVNPPPNRMSLGLILTTSTVTFDFDLVNFDLDASYLSYRDFTWCHTHKLSCEEFYPSDFWSSLNFGQVTT